MVSIKTMNLSQTVPAKRLTFTRCFHSPLISSEHPFGKPLLLLIQVIFLALIPCIANASPPGSGSPPVPLVGVEPVIVQDINPPADYVGHVEAIQTVDLRARVEGFLEQLKFKEGNHVNFGDLLYVIEQAPYKARVDSDKAGLAQAEAELTRSTQHLKRLQSALPESIPATDLDDALASQLRAKAQVAGAQASLTRSMLDISYTMIHAPISGRIGQTAFTKGNFVGPSSVPLARIVQMDPIRVVFSISENDLTVIDQPHPINFSVKDRQNSSLIIKLRLSDGTMFNGNGRIDFIDNQVDSTTGTIAVRAEFDNPEDRLIPGQYVNVLLTSAEPALLPVVPQAAVQQDHEGTYVLTVDKDDQVVVRRVKTGPVIENLWAVESGLTEGEMVIVEGIQKVQPGMTVKTTASDKGQRR
jgi:membrane fusion protein (multidrug efflux system)